LPVRGEEIIERAYEIYDARLCYLTPHQFVCEKCLKNKERFVQILRFDDEGRPERLYSCKKWKKPYLH